MTLSRFGFSVTFILYLFLLLAEFLRPGFVTTAMNAHILILVMIGWLILIASSRYEK